MEAFALAHPFITGVILGAAIALPPILILKSIADSFGREKGGPAPDESVRGRGNSEGGAT